MKLPTIIDYETHLIKCGNNTPKLVCGAVAYPDGTSTGLYVREQALDITEKTLESGYLSNHTTYFDLKVAAVERPRLLPKIFDAIDEGRVDCIVTRQKIIDNAKGELKFVWDDVKEEWTKQRGYYLSLMVEKQLGIDISKSKKEPDAWRMRYNELDDVPISEYPEAARTYPIDDTIYARELWKKQEEEVVPEGIPGLTSSMQSSWALELMSTWGVRTDPEMVEAYKKELTESFEEQAAIGKEYGFVRQEGSKNTKKIMRAVEVWCKDAGRKMKLTPKGRIGMDREQLTATDHPGLLAVAQMGKLGKHLTTYIPALERGTQYPMNSNYNVIVETFRTSCSGGRKIDGVQPGMNLQNLPREGTLRKCFVSRPGWTFAFCDYDTLEMRTLAQVCLDLFGYSHIADALRAGEDPHLSMAADMLGISYSNALRRYEAGDVDVSSARQFCKIGNYGLGGGMGIDAFISYAKGYGLIISREKAAEIHGRYRSRWKEMIDYFAHVAWLCEQSEKYEGRIEYLVSERTGMVRGRVGYTQACNHYFQHLAAVGNKEALTRVARECYVDRSSPLFGCRPWLFCHDEIGMEIPEKDFGKKRTHDAAVRLQTVMQESMQKWCPDVPIGATVAMARRWFKGAKPVMDGGFLVPSKKEGKVWVADVG